MFRINIEILKNLKYHIFKKNIEYSYCYSKCGHAYEKIFKERKSIETWKILGLMNNIEVSENI